MNTPEQTKTYAIGDRIPVAENIKETLKEISDQERAAEVALRTAAAWLARTQDSLWATIEQAHPELMKNHIVSFNHKTQEITVRRRKLADEDE